MLRDTCLSLSLLLLMALLAMKVLQPHFIYMESPTLPHGVMLDNNIIRPQSNNWSLYLGHKLFI